MTRIARFAQLHPAVGFADNFNRANSTTVLGSEWTQHVGTWGITSNQAYVSAGSGDNVATVATRYGQQGYVRCGVTTNAGDGGIVCRATDANNFILFQLARVATVGKVQIYRRLSGTYTLLAEANYTFTNTTQYLLELAFSGTSLTGKVNGATVLTTTDSNFQTVKRCGLRVFGTLARYDNFEVS